MSDFYANDIDRCLAVYTQLQMGGYSLKKNQVRMKRLGYLVHITPTSEAEKQLKFEVIPNSCCCCNLLFPQMKLPEKSKRSGPQRALRYKHMDFPRGWALGGARKALGSFSYAFLFMPSDDIYTLHNSLSNNLANVSKLSPSSVSHSQIN